MHQIYRPIIASLDMLHCRSFIGQRKRTEILLQYVLLIENSKPVIYVKVINLLSVMISIAVCLNDAYHGLGSCFLVFSRKLNRLPMLQAQVLQKAHLRYQRFESCHYH